MTSHPSVTIVGNGVAGFACAKDLAAAGVPVTLIGPGLPCDRPPLSKRALLAGRAPVLASAVDMERARIVHLDGWADEPDLRGRTVPIRLRTGEERRVAFEHLVWATGLRSVLPPVPGMEVADENAHPAAFARLVPRLERPRRHVVVIGAGLIGTETAATLAARHQVTVVERADRPLERFHGSLSAAASAVLRQCGVEFAGAAHVEGIDCLPGDRRSVRLAGRERVVADVVIAAAGVTPTAPASLGGGGRVDVDERLAIPGLPGVWACGDVARYPHPQLGRLAVPHWDNARAGGRHVAAAILGSSAPFIRQPYWFSDIGPLRIQMLGHEAAAVEWIRRDDLEIGLDEDGTARCVLMMNAPTRLAEARRLLAA
jgi:3-phenylpropionate/trans-cinnamate dioxygenase ferredoxin reductase subunit